MNEIKLAVNDKNLEVVLSLLNNLKTGLISEITTTSKATTNTDNELNNTKVIAEDDLNRPKLHYIDENTKRKKLFSFAFVTFIILSVAAAYFELYAKTYVPPFLRIILAVYWLYSLAGIIVSKIGNDYWVSKLYFNVSK